MKNKIDPLSNKPSWDSAPEGAKWLAQDFDGQWNWFGKEPNKYYNQTPTIILELTHYWEAKPGPCLWQTAAESIGISPMWTETLEKRPEASE